MKSKMPMKQKEMPMKEKDMGMTKKTMPAGMMQKMKKAH